MQPDFSLETRDSHHSAVRRDPLQSTKACYAKWNRDDCHGVRKRLHDQCDTTDMRMQAGKSIDLHQKRLDSYNQVDLRNENIA